MTKKSNKTYFLPNPEDNLVKGRIVKSDLDDMAADLGIGYPARDCDVARLKKLSLGMSVKVNGNRTVSVMDGEDEVGVIELPKTPGFCIDDIRNGVKDAVDLAESYEKRKAAEKMANAGVDIVEDDLKDVLQDEAEGKEGEAVCDQEASPEDEEANGGQEESQKAFKKNHMSEAEEVMPEKPRGGPFKLVVDAEKTKQDKEDTRVTSFYSSDDNVHAPCVPEPEPDPDNDLKDKKDKKKKKDSKKSFTITEEDLDGSLCKTERGKNQGYAEKGCPGDKIRSKGKGKGKDKGKGEGPIGRPNENDEDEIEDDNKDKD